MFDFSKNYILENKRVRLQALEANDFENLLRFAKEEPELWKYSLIQAGSAEKLRLYIDKALEGRKSKNTYAFSVYDKEKRKYAGSTRFYDIQIENASLQLGYTWYGHEFQGTGINKNCKYLLLEFAFEFLNMERVEFRADSENKKSINAMKGIGCIVEGILRSNSYKASGERRDSIVLSILKHEWHCGVKEKLEKDIAYQSH